MIAVTNAEVGRIWGTLLFPIASTGNEPGGTQVAKHYPEMMKQVHKYKVQGRFGPGKLWTYHHPKSWMSMLVFPARPTPKSEISLDYMRTGFIKLAETHEQRKIEMLQIIRMGTTAQWREITGMIFHYLGDMNVVISDPSTTHNIKMPDTWQKLEDTV